MSGTGDHLLAVADELIGSADLEGYLTDVNPAFTRVLGWSEPDLLNRPYLEYIHPEDQEPTRAAVLRLQETRRQVDYRNRWRTKTGQYLWVEWRAYLHEKTIYAIGRPREPEPDDLEAVVTRVVRQEAAVQERRRTELTEAREKKHEKERAELETQLTDSETRATVEHTRAKTLKVWVGAAIAVATTIGGGARWAINRIEENALRAKELEDRREKVDTEIKRFTTRIQENERKIQRLGEVAVETQVQVSDSTEFLGKKIDAAHPRTADKVEVPETVRRAAVKAQAVKDARTQRQLFDGAQSSNPADPFADLEASASAPPGDGAAEGDRALDKDSAAGDDKAP